MFAFTKKEQRGSVKLSQTYTEGTLSNDTRLKLSVLAALFCALVFALIRLHTNFFYHIIPKNSYLVFHMVAEFTSVIVSFSVFTVGWHGYKQNKNKQDLFIGMLFLIIGIVDFVHTLSYKGMPDFLSPNSVSKASTYWIAARLVSSIGLFIAAFISPGSRNKWLSPLILGVASLSVISAIIVIESYYPALIPPMFVQGVGQSTLKINLERVVIIFYLAAFYVFGKRQSKDLNIFLLQMAILVSVFSEFSFALYTSPFDSYNFLGHIFKVVATAFIFRALFVSSMQKPYFELVKARDQIEQSFSRIGAALASSLELDDVLQLITQLASSMLRSNHAVVMMLRDGELYIRTQWGMRNNSTEVSQDHTSAGFVLSTKKPIVISDVMKFAGHSPDCHCQHLDGPPARSVVSAPILFGNEILGVVEVYSSKVDAFTSKEAQLLSSFARQASVAINNSLAYERERTIAQTLQQSLLPPAPEISGFDIAVRYVPAEDTARVGGDLYDVFAVDNDHLALVIGDICGHGLDAASTMSKVVHTIKALLTQGLSPEEALRGTNMVLCRTTSKRAMFATVFACILNMRTKELHYSNAGHPMPIILDSSGCRLIETSSGLPLGIDESVDYKTSSIGLGDANGLLLYTDGTIEARKQGELFETQRMSKICNEYLEHSMDDMLDKIISEVRNWAGTIQDDIAMLAIKWER